MAYLDVDGTLVHFETQGQGPPVVLIHALVAGKDMWRAQIRELSHDFQVIALDARGVGGSGAIVGWRKVLDQMSGDVIAVLDHLGIEQSAVCGVSFGGVIAQHLATRHPHRVSRLMVVDSYSNTRPTTVSRAVWLASVLAGAPSNLMPKRWLSALMRRAYLPQWPRAASYLAGATMRFRPVDGFKARVAISFVNFLPLLAQGDYPLTAVVGSDSWPRSMRFTRELARAVPRTKVVVVPHSNDPTPLCQPWTFTTLLRRFLREGLPPEDLAEGPGAAVPTVLPTRGSEYQRALAGWLSVR